MSNCTFSSNTAAVNGAGIFQELTKGTLDACILRANKAQVRLFEPVTWDIVQHPSGNHASAEMDRLLTRGHDNNQMAFLTLALGHVGHLGSLRKAVWPWLE